MGTVNVVLGMFWWRGGRTGGGGGGHCGGKKGAIVGSMTSEGWTEWGGMENDAGNREEEESDAVVEDERR